MRIEIIEATIEQLKKQREIDLYRIERFEVQLKEVGDK